MASHLLKNRLRLSFWGRWKEARLFLLVLSIDQLSESRSDDVSERRLSEDARSGLTRKEAKNAALFLLKKLFCKEALGNACIKWLPVLYYECSRLNGLWSPFGIETKCIICIFIIV
jgi:hypothetical protein